MDTSEAVGSRPQKDSAVPSSSPGDRRAAVRFAVGILAVVWFFLIASHLWRTDSVLWTQGKVAPLGVFSYLAGAYDFSWSNSPPGPLAMAVLWLAVYGLIGWMFVRSVDVYVGRLECAALALVFGAGLCGLGYEFLGMAHLLTRWGVLAVTVAIGAVVWWLASSRGRGPLEVWRSAVRKMLGEQVSALDSGDAIEDPRARATAAPKRKEGWMSLEDSARAFAGGGAQRKTLRLTWCAAWKSTLEPDLNSPIGVVWLAGFVILAAITVLTFYHALFYPETYWDSLILYLGYGRMTFLEHGFPFKAVAQVGYGLGANYPHLYSTHAAAVSAVMGSWSDVSARLLVPVSALGATLLIYATALRIWRNHFAAMVCAMAFRALPYVTAYSTYASDYGLALLLSAAMIYLAVRYIESPLPGMFVLLTCVPAISMHLNYLMGVLWVVWGVALVAAHWARPKSPLDAVVSGERPLRRSVQSIDDEYEDEQVEAEPYFAQGVGTPGVWGLLATRRFWAVTVAAVILGSTWNVRNWCLTGNPVYAFFPGIFGGIRINEEVLRSAEREWFLNGDGIGRLAETVPSMTELTHPDDELTTLTPGGAKAEEELTTRTLSDRLAASWMYWVGFETFRYPGEGERLYRGRWIDRLTHLALHWRVPDDDQPLSFAGVWIEGKDSESGRLAMPMKGTAVLHWRHAYKLAPFAVGLALPGALLWLAILVRRGTRRWTAGREGLRVRVLDVETRAGLIIVVFTFLFLAYEYLVADLYLYQILPVAVGIGLLSGWVPGALLRWGGDRIRRAELYAIFGILYVLVILSGLVPGVAMALMGFKFTGAGEIGGKVIAQTNLGAFHYPGMSAEEFMRLQYGADVDAWDYLNRTMKGQRLLTHENRHYALAPEITLVHLDDWDIQKTYLMSDDREKMALLRELGIRYYYAIPNEEKHAVNRRVGLDAWKENGWMREVRRWNGNVLYELNWGAAGLSDTPPDKLKELESYRPRTQ